MNIFPSQKKKKKKRHLCASYKDQKQAAIETPKPCLAQQAESVSSNERGSSTTPGQNCLQTVKIALLFWQCILESAKG